MYCKSGGAFVLRLFTLTRLSVFSSSLRFPRFPMDRKEKKLNNLLLVILPFGLFAIAWAVVNVVHVSVGPPLVPLAVATVFLSTLLKIQLPRSNVHLTISDALLIISLVVYGGAVAVLLAAAEAAFTSFVIRRSGETIKLRTGVLNVLNAAVVMFVVTWAVRLFFGSGNLTDTAKSTSGIITLLLTIALTLFIASIIC